MSAEKIITAETLGAQSTDDNLFSASSAPPRWIIEEIGALPPGALVYEPALEKMLGMGMRAIDRAIERGQLPPGVKVGAKRLWTAGSIVKWIDARIERAAKENERVTKCE